MCGKRPKHYRVGRRYFCGPEPDETKKVQISTKTRPRAVATICPVKRGLSSRCIVVANGGMPDTAVLLLSGNCCHGSPETGYQARKQRGLPLNPRPERLVHIRQQLIDSLLINFLGQR